jgi:riboflavin biosynthesis pyrimidine reductase
VRELYPRARTVELDELYRGLTLSAGIDRPWWLAIGMVASVDGAAAVDGRSGGLGGTADRLALARLRDACDVVLVGAATVRQEGYGPLAGNRARREDRRRRGLAPLPRLAILTASGDLDPRAAVFSHPEQRPLVLTTGAALSATTGRLGDLADVVALGAGRVEVAAAVEHLADLGLRRILCEGGPRVNSQVVAAGLVEEAFVTVAPLAVGGGAPRIAQGPEPERAEPLRLESALLHGDELLLRYRAARHPRP